MKSYSTLESFDFCCSDTKYLKPLENSPNLKTFKASLELINRDYLFIVSTFSNLEALDIPLCYE